MNSYNQEYVEITNEGENSVRLIKTVSFAKSVAALLGVLALLMSAGCDNPQPEAADRELPAYSNQIFHSLV